MKIITIFIDIIRLITDKDSKRIRLSLFFCSATPTWHMWFVAPVKLFFEISVAFCYWIAQFEQSLDDAFIKFRASLLELAAIKICDLQIDFGKTYSASFHGTLQPFTPLTSMMKPAATRSLAYRALITNLFTGQFRESIFSQDTAERRLWLCRQMFSSGAYACWTRLQRRLASTRCGHREEGRAWL